ncbi:MAG: hypothetical protein IJT07_04320, partial [Oscillospiraceae bacterium]|nr:hypothetical protein [Oscillospiraceae bacterium]
MKTTKRILSLLLAVALVLSAAPMGLFTPASAANQTMNGSSTAAMFLRRIMVAHENTLNYTSSDTYKITFSGNTNVDDTARDRDTIAGWSKLSASYDVAWNGDVADALIENYMHEDPVGSGEYTFASKYPALLYSVSPNAGYTVTLPFWSDSDTDSVIYGGSGTIIFNLKDEGALANYLELVANGKVTTGTTDLQNARRLVMKVDDGSVSEDLTVPIRTKLTVASGLVLKANDLTVSHHATNDNYHASIDGDGEIWVAGTVTNAAQISGPAIFKYVTTAADLTDALEDAALDGVVLGDSITANDAVEIPAGKTIDFNGNTLITDSYTNNGTERNKVSTSVQAPASPNVGSKVELDAALDAGLTAIALTTDIDYDDVLTIPTGTTIDLAGSNLYVTGLVNNGTLTKNGGKLWANVSTDSTLAATPSAADVSNIWAANEELLRTGTEFDGIRLTASITAYSNAVTSSAEANKASILPRMAAEGAFASGLYRAMPRIPEGKTLDLNGKTLVALAANTSFGTATMGTGTIAANGGQIKLRIHNQGGWKFAVQTANAHPGIVSEIRHNNSTKSISTLGNDDPAYPVPAGVAVATNGCKLTDVVFEVASEADFTREGTSNANITVVGFKLVNNITLSEDIDVGAKDVDYDNHTVTGGSIITTGTVSNKPVVASPNVGTKAELDLALDAGLTAITLLADIDYDDVLTIPTGVTIDLNGKNLYVTGLVNNGTITKNEGKLWANASASATLTETPTAADVSNIWAANEELLAAETEFDGIRLTANLAYGSAATAASKATILPNLYAAAAFVNNNGLGHAVVKIPAGKILDLNGHTFNMAAAQSTLGSGTIETNG